MNKNHLLSLIENQKLVIVGGSGGVGKTTLSASIAIQAALEGRKVAVLTIDPARRLGTTLGFRHLGNKLHYISDQKLKPLQKRPGGSLAACMLDVKGTFDGIVSRYAPSSFIKERILLNPFYVQLSEALSGTHEYMALEKIYEIRSSQEFDLLVLDTPSSDSFLQFLEAPLRLKSFLDRDIVRWFSTPRETTIGRLACAAFGKQFSSALSLLNKLAGGTVLADLANFLTDFQSLFEGLRERTEEVEQLIKDREASLFLVTTCEVITTTQLHQLLEPLKAFELRLSGFILNRTLDSLQSKSPSMNPLELALSNTAKRIITQQEQLKKRLKKEQPKVPIFEVPLLKKDPSKIIDLAQLSFTE